MSIRILNPDGICLTVPRAIESAKRCANFWGTTYYVHKTPKGFAVGQRRSAKYELIETVEPTSSQNGTATKT